MNLNDRFKRIRQQNIQSARLRNPLQSPVVQPSTVPSQSTVVKNSIGPFQSPAGQPSTVPAEPTGVRSSVGPLQSLAVQPLTVPGERQRKRPNVTLQEGSMNVEIRNRPST